MLLLFTIHNALQGQFSFDLSLSPFDLNFTVYGMDNQINPLAATKCAWKVTTVSKPMKELKQTAKGLSGYLTMRKVYRYTQWHRPQSLESKTVNDSCNFPANNLSQGKKQTKMLCNYFNLDPSKPTFSFYRQVGLRKRSKHFNRNIRRNI